MSGGDVTGDNIEVFTRRNQGDRYCYTRMCGMTARCNAADVRRVGSSKDIGDAHDGTRGGHSGDVHKPTRALARLGRGAMQRLWGPLIQCSIARPHGVLYGSYRVAETSGRDLRACTCSIRIPVLCTTRTLRRMRLGPHMSGWPLRLLTADETRTLHRTHYPSVDATPIDEQLTSEHDLTNVHDVLRVHSVQALAVEHRVKSPDSTLLSLLILALTSFISGRTTVQSYDYSILTHGQSEECCGRALPPCLDVKVAAITGSSKSHRNCGVRHLADTVAISRRDRGEGCGWRP